MSDIEKVKKLREATGAGFKDCNLAIKESNGDLDKAIEILRVKGISKASKKMSRDAKEGVIAVSGRQVLPHRRRLPGDLDPLPIRTRA